MNELRITFSLFMLFVGTMTYGQKIADKYFDEQKYEVAAKIYQGTYDKGKDVDIKLLERLGYCYQILNRYDEAEKYYAEAVNDHVSSPSTILAYGQILKNQNKINQARTQFKNYLEREDSEEGRSLLISCDSVGVWTLKPSNINTKNFEEINTAFLEITPYPRRKEVVFSSNRIEGIKEKALKDLSVELEPFSLYVYNPAKGEDAVSEFSKDINSNQIESNAYFNKDGDKLFYTRANTNNSGQLEIHIAHEEDGVWVKDNPFNRNNPKYSYTNPVLSNDGSTLFFASDKLGGEGGMDIYFSTKAGLSYSAPVNLGKVINTPGNEVPSFIDDNGTLYFSSNYHPGFGGMDVFMAKKSGDTYSSPINLKSPINSSKDDIGYILSSSTSGYFASNRAGGKGSDDIYSFSIIDFSDRVNYKDLSGSYANDEGGIANQRLVLLDANDVIIRTVVTDSNGEFVIKDVPNSLEYKILVDETIDDIDENAKITITNDNNNKSTLLERLQKDMFKFESLAIDGGEELTLIDDLDESGLPTLVIFGQLDSKDETKVLNQKRVYVVDKEGKYITSTLTDHLGKFQFEKLSIDDQYLFQLEEEDAEIDIQIINSTGEVIGRTMKNKDGVYVYHKFTINPSDKPDIRGVFKFGNLPADGVSLMLIDENDDVIQIQVTDAKGGFDFQGLNPGEDYKIQVDSNIEIPANANLFLMDSHTGLLMPVSKLANGSFEFQTLAPIPPEELVLMEEEDYEIKPTTNIRGQVKSKGNKMFTSGLVVQVMDVDGKIIALANTNDKGYFNFFNLPLQDQYLFGMPEDDESFSISVLTKNNKVISNAKKNENNQYVYHKFTINPSNQPDVRGVFKYGNLPANDVTLNLIDESDEVIQFTKTNSMGEFSFKKLYAGKSYRIAVDKSEKNVPANANMFVQDQYTGLMLPVSKLNNGQFKFETLAPIEAEELALVETKDETSIPTFSFFGQLYSSKSIGTSDVKINILDKSGKVIASSRTDKMGRFNYQKLPLDEEYLLQINADDPSFKLKVISKNGDDVGELTRNQKDEFVFNRNAVYTPKVAEKDKTPPMGDDITISISKEYKPIVNFEFGGSNLSQQSKNNLVYLTKYLNSNEELKLEINSHTDAQGRAEYNMWLSEQRGNEVKNFLVAKGVQKERIKVNSFGETQLLNECSDGVECPPEKQAANRRVELKYFR